MFAQGLCCCAWLAVSSACGCGCSAAAGAGDVDQPPLGRAGACLPMARCRTRMHACARWQIIYLADCIRFQRTDCTGFTLRASCFILSPGAICSPLPPTSWDPWGASDMRGDTEAGELRMWAGHCTAGSAATWQGNRYSVLRPARPRRHLPRPPPSAASARRRSASSCACTSARCPAGSAARPRSRSTVAWPPPCSCTRIASATPALDPGAPRARS